jgi:hypothetical protein
MQMRYLKLKKSPCENMHKKPSGYQMVALEFSLINDPMLTENSEEGSSIW